VHRSDRECPGVNGCKVIHSGVLLMWYRRGLVGLAAITFGFLLARWLLPIAAPPGRVLQEVVPFIYFGWRLPLATPSRLDNTLIACSEAAAVARLSVADGSVLWQCKLPWDSVYLPPVELGGTIVIVTQKGYVYGIAEKNGVIAWRRRVLPWWDPLSGIGEIHHVIAEDNAIIMTPRQVVSLDVTEGAVVWRWHAPADMLLVGLQALPRGCLVYGRGRVYGRLRVVVMDWAGGSLRTAIFPVNVRIVSVGPPAVDEHVLYLPIVKQQGAALLAIELSRGQMLWRRQEVTDALSAPVVVDDQLYSFSAGHVFGLRKQTGDLVWQSPFVTNHAWALAAYGTLVLVGGPGGIWGVSEKLPAPRKIYSGSLASPFLLAADKVIFMSDRKCVTAVELSNGSLVWERQLK